MQLNYDCIRDILLKVEDISFNSRLPVDKLAESLPNYSKAEIQYHCNYLYEAELIKAITSADIDNASPFVFYINDLTPNGHQFIANIRSDTVWAKVKKHLIEIGIVSVSAILEVASETAIAFVRQALGSP